MSTHLEHQLDSVETSITQQITNILDRRVTAVAPKLHFFNNPAGTYTMTIKDGGTTIGTKSLTMAGINTLVTTQEGSSLAYKVGYFSFVFDAPIRLSRNVEYDLILTTSGYTFSASSSVAWVKEYLNETNKLGSTPTAQNDLWKAFSYRLWEI